MEAVSALIFLVGCGLLVSAAFMVTRNSKGRPVRIFVGCILILLAVLALPIFIFLLPWTYDALISSNEKIRVEVPGYTVVLRQTPGNLVLDPSDDLYASSFLITRNDGKTAYLMSDPDDNRWNQPSSMEIDGKIYFLRGPDGIGDETAFVDPATGILFSGHSDMTRKLDELDYK